MAAGTLDETAGLEPCLADLALTDRQTAAAVHRPCPRVRRSSPCCLLVAPPRIRRPPTSPPEPTAAPAVCEPPWPRELIEHADAIDLLTLGFEREGLIRPSESQHSATFRRSSVDSSSSRSSAAVQPSNFPAGKRLVTAITDDICGHIDEYDKWGADPGWGVEIRRGDDTIRIALDYPLDQYFVAASIGGVLRRTRGYLTPLATHAILDSLVRRHDLPVQPRFTTPISSTEDDPATLKAREAGLRGVQHTLDMQRSGAPLRYP